MCLKLKPLVFKQVLKAIYQISRGVGTLSQLMDILAYFHHSCPAPHVLCIQFSFDSPDIYRTMSYMTGYFQTI